MKTWRPNQSGTFSNRTAVHATDDTKLFVIEFTEHPDMQQRAKIVEDICNLHETKSELLEALQKAHKLVKQLGIEEDMDIEEFDYMEAAINKALTH